MEIVLRNISISHNSTSLRERERYHLGELERETLASKIKKDFKDIKGLLLLSTCNRTEVYFESYCTSAADLRDHFIRQINPNGNSEYEATFFHINNRTVDTAFHLLHVANGLRSAVVGDGQILSQIKEAYQFSFKSKMHGSIMERVLQAVFKSHKRISNESSFRNGSTSTAYRALKLIEENFGKAQMGSKKLLVIGAGEIGKEVLKYLTKFNFSDAYLSNRTETKAKELAGLYGIKVWPWENVENGNYGEFDAIITGVSNRRNLLTKKKTSTRKMIIVDLALPSNVSSELRYEENTKLFDIDAVTDQIDQTDMKRRGAIEKVEEIIQEEMKAFIDWYSKGEIRAFLLSYKRHAKELIDETIQAAVSDKLSAEEKDLLIEMITRKLVKMTAKVMNAAHAGELSENNMEFIKKAFSSQTYAA